MTALCDRTLRAGGPALLFETPPGHAIPVLGNLFGTTRRVALGMGVNDVSELRQFGHVLAMLKEPEAPKGLKDLLGLGSMLKTLWHMAPKELRSAACQDVVYEGKDVDLACLPIQHCWPDDVAPLITWSLVITQGPHKARQNLGIYRQQVLARNKVIMRWLPQRGGALDFREHGALHPGHARRVMFGIWSFLRQFMYTKFIVVVDEDINIRDWKDVIWAITTRVDPTRDTLLADSTPIDYLDFASPVSGLGSKMTPIHQGFR